MGARARAVPLFLMFVQSLSRSSWNLKRLNSNGIIVIMKLHGD